ncbi:MAG: EF-hand domain-containing protein [Pseudomonadota bacterium]
MKSTLALVFGFAIATSAALSVAAGSGADAATTPNNDAGISPPAVNAPAINDPQNVDSQQVSGTGSLVFQKLDKNKDGYVDQSEAKNSVPLQSDFKSIDTDHDGKISRDELRNYQSK